MWVEGPEENVMYDMIAGADWYAARGRDDGSWVLYWHGKRIRGPFGHDETSELASDEWVIRVIDSLEADLKNGATISRLLCHLADVDF